MHRALLIVIIGLVIAGAVLALAQMWLAVLSWEIFVKAMVTIAVLVTALGLVLALKSDLAENKKLKDENYLD